MLSASRLVQYCQLQQEAAAHTQATLVVLRNLKAGVQVRKALWYILASWLR